MITTVIPIGDHRETTFTVQTIPTTEGACSHDHDRCGKPGVIAVRHAIEMQHPAEGSAMRITLCAEHQDATPGVHARWVADAREMQDPVKRDAYLTSVGVTN
ncbi:hypothetical protein ABT275_03715 [Streptomyces sp. NPDC001185]|uniref:hypothetical protein n=1 Tax=Streptomyces sp. NPDC001185 TaxID=3154380 RepID=UPI00331833CA